MQEQVHARKQDTTEDEAEVTPAAQDAATLDEDVACCLADIDAVLGEVETEKDRAIREFKVLKELEDAGEDYETGLRVWKAQYAHLNLEVYDHCCLTLFDPEADGGTGEVLA